jgi:capsular exopolysaccharide synthesis family protein
MSAESPRSPAGAPSLVVLAQPKSAAAEAFRTLRINLQFSSLDEHLHTVLVASAGADEGKTTTLANLGAVCALAGARVTLVDADLRRPSLHDLFHLPNGKGLTTAMLERATTLPLQDTGVEGLRVLASGPVPPNPAELLASRRMDEMLELLRADADLVLIDAPPVNAVADASILAPRVDGVVLVIDARKTRREPARQAKAQLERVHARLLGVVLNNTRVTAPGYP